MPVILHPFIPPPLRHCSSFSVSTFLTKSRRFLAPRATPVHSFRVSHHYILRPYHLSTKLSFQTLSILLTSHILFPPTHAMSSRPSILQLQTQAANGARPIQNPLPKANRSDESISTVSSSGSSSPKSSLDIVRCSRCQRSLSIDTSLPANQSGAVRFGLNSYYCTRCANVVGFVK